MSGVDEPLRADDVGLVVHVWVGELPRPSAGDDSWSVLDVNETARALRFANADARDRFVAAHAGFRRVLGRWLRVDPAEVVFARAVCVHCGGPHGKPTLAPLYGHRTEVSLSHSGAAVAAAMSTVPVGIDVECHRPLAHGAIAARWFTEAEQQFVGDDAASSERFFRIWTRKEAVLKATGEGLPGGLATVDLPGEGGPVRYVERNGVRWTVVDLPAPAGHAAAAAYLGEAELVLGLPGDASVLPALLRQQSGGRGGT